MTALLVRLVWDSFHDRVIIRYRDQRTGDTSATDVPKAGALKAVEHPNAYRRLCPAAVA
jgi:hypothetical protein